MINGPELEFNRSYSVTRCYSNNDELVSSSNSSNNIDGKLAISEKRKRAFNWAKIRLIHMGSL